MTDQQAMTINIGPAAKDDATTARDRPRVRHRDGASDRRIVDPGAPRSPAGQGDSAWPRPLVRRAPVLTRDKEAGGAPAVGRPRRRSGPGPGSSNEGSAMAGAAPRGGGATDGATRAQTSETTQ